MKKVIYLITVLVVSISSCKKKATAEPASQPGIAQMRTIQPSSYLPAFPGSFWKYINSKNDTIVSTTSSTYVKDGYQDWEWIGATGQKKILKSDSAYVPLYNGIPIWDGYGHLGPIFNYMQLQAPSLIGIVPDRLSEGISWTTSAVSHDSRYSRILKKDTMIQISGTNYYPIIIISGEESLEFGKHVSTIFKQYYAKDIGLVKSETFDDWGALISEMHIISYHINK